MTLPTIPERVQNGVAWLDANKPGWPDLVDLADLDMTDSCRCVLGHAFSVEAGMYRECSDPECGCTLTGFAFAAGVIGLNRDDEDFEKWAEALGFDLPSDEQFFEEDEDDLYIKNWNALTDEWRRVITERRRVDQLEQMVQRARDRAAEAAFGDQVAVDVYS